MGEFSFLSYHLKTGTIIVEQVNHCQYGGYESSKEALLNIQTGPGLGKLYISSHPLIYKILNLIGNWFMDHQIRNKDPIDHGTIFAEACKICINY